MTNTKPEFLCLQNMQSGEILSLEEIGGKGVCAALMAVAMQAMKENDAYCGTCNKGLKIVAGDTPNVFEVVGKKANL